jgi:sugar phosphate permease
VFSLVGAAYIIMTGFAASRGATLLGATQMFGMAGGFAGQVVVGPAIAAGLPWSSFWLLMGCVGIVIAVALLLLVPKSTARQQSANWLREAGHALITVFRNPQSILCGLISGLIFVPTSIFDMVWGVRYLQEAHFFDYGEAVMRSSMVPLGWIIGCPLLGFLSDRIGRRKPVIAGAALVLLACLAWILFGPREALPPYLLGIVTGVASGAAMLPYTVIKEANPANMGGTATGVVNFLNFTLTALLGPVYGALLTHVSGGAADRTLEHYQAAFQSMLYGVGLAFVLTLLLRETGPATRRAAS